MTSIFPETSFARSSEIPPSRLADFEHEPAPLHVHGDPVRVFRFADCMSRELDGWIEEAFPAASRRSISETYIANFIEGAEPYAAAIVAANDLERAKKFLRYNRPLLDRYLRIALLPASRPPQRANLLMAGYDDVFDTRMVGDEARMRLAAMAARARIYGRLTRGTTVDSGTVMVETAFARPLSPREAALAHLLATHAASGISRPAILAAFAAEARTITPDALKVLISKLRAKLAPGWAIASNRGYAYRLQMADAPQPAWPVRSAQPTLR